MNFELAFTHIHSDIQHSKISYQNLSQKSGKSQDFIGKKLNRLN